MNNVAVASHIAASNSESVNERAGARLRLFWLCFALSAVVYCQLHFWSRPERKDTANWDYFAQVISRGGVPYRDVVNIKTPLSAYIGAAAILIGKPFGLRDIYAIRITYVLVASLTVAFTFLIASQFFDSLRIGILAALILLGVEQFAILNMTGVQPKTPMALFGLISLWAILNRSPFIAGICGMLSALSWQPGLLFIGTAGLAFSKYLTSWRDLKVAKLLAGAAVPLVILLTYLWAAGALRDFYLWCLHYPFSVYGPRELTTGQDFLAGFAKLLTKPYGSDRIYFYLSIGGLVLALAWEVIEGVKRGFRAVLNLAPRHQIIIAPLVYFLFCRVDMQGRQDVIPLLPFVAIFSAALVVYYFDATANMVAKLRGRPSHMVVQRIGFAIVCVVVLVGGLSSVFSVRTGAKHLKAEMTDVADIVSLLDPGDEIFVHGWTEILVLSGLTNARRYTNLDHGKDSYLDQIEPGGFEGWFERLKADRPKIVALFRVKNVDHRDVLLSWVKSSYEPREGRVFTYYVRRDQ